MRNPTVVGYFSDAKPNVRSPKLFVIEFVAPLVVVPLLERLNELTEIGYIQLKNSGYKYRTAGFVKKRPTIGGSQPYGGGQSSPVANKKGPRGLAMRRY